MRPPSRDDMPVAPVADSRPEGAGDSAEAQKAEVSVTRADLEERVAASITRREFIVDAENRCQAYREWWHRQENKKES